MATELTKPVRRTEPRSQLTITMAPDGLYLREKGSRMCFGPLSYGRLYLQAVREHLEIKKREKAAKVAARKTARRGR